MSSLEEARRLVEEAVHQLNRELPGPERIDLNPDTPLIGPATRLDSLGLVSLIAFLEGKLRERCDHPLALVDEKGLDPATSPFRTLATLTEHVAGFL